MNRNVLIRIAGWVGIAAWTYVVILMLAANWIPPIVAYPITMDTMSSISVYLIPFVVMLVVTRATALTVVVIVPFIVLGLIAGGAYDE